MVTYSLGVLFAGVDKGANMANLVDLQTRILQRMDG